MKDYLENVSLSELDDLDLASANEVLEDVKSNTNWKSTENHVTKNGVKWVC